MKLFHRFVSPPCLVLGLASLLMLAATAASAQTKPPVNDANRAKVSAALSKGDLAGAQKILTGLQKAAGGGPVGGSVAFEEITACGFYPQETRLECVIEIKQAGGYGGPVGSFGSFEFVQLCVDWDGDDYFNANESVGLGIVQMHDEAGQAPPPWHYAVYRDINPPGGLRTSNDGASTTTTTYAPTRRARAILSWAAAPTGCDYSPVWGNVFDFRIRLDPIR